MTPREAGKLLGMTESKVRWLCQRRKLAHFRFESRIQITPEQLDEYKQGCLIEAAPEKGVELKWLRKR